MRSSATSFDDILAASHLPQSGPELYSARRKLWLSPRTDGLRFTPEPPTSYRKLEKLLSTPNAELDDRVWNSGIGEVWKGLSTGANLKWRLPMALMIKIIRAAWVRDETWPAGAVAPDSDDAMPDQQSNVLATVTSPTLTEGSISGVTTPQR